ncbi:hypothetical protein D3C81_1193980 [compost metagenome]
MGLVVAGDGADHPALQRRAQAVAVAARAQRRLHVIQAGETGQRLVGEDQLVQRHIGGHRQAAGLGGGDHLRAAGAADLAEVGAHAALLDQQQVAGQGHGLGGFRDAGQAEEAGGRPFVGQAAGGEVGVLRGEHHGEVEGGGVLQGTAQHAVVDQRRQAVGEGHAAGVAQGDQFGQLFAGQALGQGADGEHAGVVGGDGAVEGQFDHGRRVQHRLGLRRAAQAGDAAGSGGAGFAGDGALAGVARLAQAHRQVDQAGRGDQAVGGDLLLGGEAGRRRAEGDDAAVLDVDVAGAVEGAGRVDHAGAVDADFHWASPCSSWRWACWPLMAMDSTAMRMAMP